MSNIAHTIDILSDLIAYPTVSSDSNLAMIDDLTQRLKDADATVERIENNEGTKANIFATFGDPSQSGGLVLSGHTDVVPVSGQNWSQDPFTLTRSDDGERLYGRGTCDMKGSIACAMSLVPELKTRSLTRPLHFAFSYDEETGCLGGAKLVEHLAKRECQPSAAIIGEPTMMKIVDGHKGINEYTTQFHGLEGHSSRPDLGVNALEFATLYLAKLFELRDQMPNRAPSDSAFEPPYTTLGFGKLESGTIHNVIPHFAELFWEMRPIQATDTSFVKAELARYCDEQLLPAMQAIYPQASIQTQTIAEVVGLEPADENEARDIVRQLTHQNSTQLVSYGTEAGLFQTLGLSAIVCGPGSIDQAHKADEYVEVAQLETCNQMLSKLLDTIARA